MIKIISTKGSSNQYGECEKCGKYCTEIFHVFDFDPKNYVDVFGCLSCCEKVKNDFE